MAQHELFLKENEVSHNIKISRAFIVDWWSSAIHFLTFSMEKHTPSMRILQSIGGVMFISVFVSSIPINWVVSFYMNAF